MRSNPAALPCTHPSTHRHDLPAACSAKVALAQVGNGARLLVVCLLDGTTLALKEHRINLQQAQPPGALGRASMQAQQRAQELAGEPLPPAAGLTEAWRHQGPGPVFSSPITADSLVIVGHLEGTIVGLHAASGIPCWQQRLLPAGPHLFADLACSPAHVGAPQLLAATHASRVHCLRCADGVQLWEVDLCCGPISAAPAWVVAAALGACTTGNSQFDAATAGKHSEGGGGESGGAAGSASVTEESAEALVVVASNSGLVTVLRMGCDAARDGSGGGGSSGPFQPERLCQMQMPGEVFSSPVAIGDMVVLGCRDNRLHCLWLAAAPAAAPLSGC